MKGKVILELEEYEELVRKNSNQIDEIIEETNKLNIIKKDINKQLIIEKVKYIGGYTDYYVDRTVEQLLEIAKKDFIKNTSIKEFKKLKRGN